VKRGRQVGDADLCHSEKLREVLQKLHIPVHQAPGEAEAECCRMNRLGLVDAVWSEDGDALIFRCTKLVKFIHDEEGKKRIDAAEVWDMKDIYERTGLNHKSIALFGILVGCDYDTTGLQGCGRALAETLSTASKGLAERLFYCAKSLQENGHGTNASWEREH